MHPRDAGILASRIVGLYFGISAVIQFASYFAFQAKPFSASARFLIPVGALALVGLLLWLRASQVGDAIARGTSATAPGTQRPIEQLRGLGAFILGLFLTALAIPAIVAASVSDIAGAPVFGIFVPFGGRASALATAITQLIIGVTLMGWGESQMPRRPRPGHKGPGEL